MRLLREYVRELLTESIDPKIMSMIDQADRANYHVETTSGAARIYDGSKNLIASVTWYPAEAGPYFGPCSQSSIVNYSTADEGLGPLAYDVAIEVTGGLASDRTEVSSDAEAVWNRYMTSRSDVVVDQLDIMDDYELPQLTPNDESDDCEQVPAYGALKDKWHISPLSKKYSKAGSPVMDELRKRGMLYER